MLTSLDDARSLLMEGEDEQEEQADDFEHLNIIKGKFRNWNIDIIRL